MPQNKFKFLSDKKIFIQVIKTKRILSKTLEYSFIYYIKIQTLLHELQNEENNNKNLLYHGVEEFEKEPIKLNGLV